MPQCSVPGCTKQGGHKFRLSNKPLLDKWIVAIKREEHGKKGPIMETTKKLECVMNISMPLIIKPLIIMVSIITDAPNFVTNLFSKSMNTYQ